MIVDSLLTNAKAYFNNSIVDCSIAIEGDTIFKIGKETQMPDADEKINLRSHLVLPGLIDAHTHLRDEGKTYKEDFYTGTAAAAAGGFSTVLDMPNNAPVTMSTSTLKNRMNIAERRVLVNVGFYSEFPERNEEISDIVAQGALAFKLFMGCQIGGLNIDDDEALRDALEKTGTSGVPVAVHAEDRALLKETEDQMKSANRHDVPAFLKVHSELVETTAIERILRVSSKVDVHLHFCHMTNEESLNAVIDAKKSDRSVTCEVTPQHLLLSTNDFKHRGSMLVMVPPLRSQSNLDALWKGITGGWIDSVGSDHAPHTFDEKSNENIWEVKVGIPGLETTLPLALTMVKKNRLTIAKVVQLLAEKPAGIFGLSDRGRLEKGKKADMVVIDFNQKFKIDASSFRSKAKFSPFDEWEVYGKPVKTFVNGKLIMDEKQIVAKPGSGTVIRREHK